MPNVAAAPEWFEFALYAGAFLIIVYLGRVYMAWHREQKLKDVECHELIRPNTYLCFRRQPDGTFPVPALEDANMVIDVFVTAEMIWSGNAMLRPSSSLRYNIWPIHYSTQRVFYTDRPWNELPNLPQYASNPEYTPTGDGWGGMAQVIGSTAEIGIATYHPGRSPVALLAHELVHVCWGIHAHNEEFAAKEKELKEAMGI